MEKIDRSLFGWWPPRKAQSALDILRSTTLLDPIWYRENHPDLRGTAVDAAKHYLEYGASEGRNPGPMFDTLFYLRKNPQVAASGVNPLVHYVLECERQGRQPTRVAPDLPPQSNGEATALPQLKSPTGSVGGRVQQASPRVGPRQTNAETAMSAGTARALFDAHYYLTTYSDIRQVGIDPLTHFLEVGHLEGRNPNADFNTTYYRSKYLRGTNENPLLHYERVGRALGFSTAPGTDGGIADEVAKNTKRSELFEPVDPTLLRGRTTDTNILAFYLPQFHRIPENDDWWGQGFTEWTNVARGLPRYKGHYQPRIPSELGYYDLSHPRIMMRQATLARSMGISGFIFHHYWFNGKRLLEAPLDAALENPEFDMPFALIWANENWTRAWDGGDQEILMRQDYRLEDTDALVADLARYMSDRRYIKLDNRPLFIIYRPGIIPDANKHIALWRDKFRTSHDLDPLMFMAQFDKFDPREYGLDGAVEFPPHKIGKRLPLIGKELIVLDDSFEQRVFSYTDMVDAALSEPDPEFDLIRSVFPMWDNDARRQRFSTSFAGSTPKEYERWLSGAIAYAKRRPVRSQSIVCVNAWNEWAEGAYLEPDVHFGGAYLNATARALVSATKLDNKPGVLLVGHDAHDHGAQRLLLAIATHMNRTCGIRLEIALLGPGNLVRAYQRIAPTTICGDETSFRNLVVKKQAEGFTVAICNTTPGGRYINVLRDLHLRTVALVHELPTVLQHYGLQHTASAIAAHADVCVFSSNLARPAFEMFAGASVRRAVIQPQGLYDDISALPDARKSVRRELGIPADAKIVVNVAYGDLRKGFDLFRHVARRFEDIDQKTYFLWVGAIERELKSWMVDNVPNGGRVANFLTIGFREDLGRILYASDVYLLTSREDPFPTSMIDSIAAGLPTVAMQDGGGFVELFTHDFVGRLAPFENIEGLCDDVRHFLELPIETKVAQAQQRRELIKRDFDFSKYAFELLRLGQIADKSVSVIVPNYNYSSYLRKRLSGIFNQTYPIFEIIVLDDASTDGSLAALDRIVAEFERDVVRVVNAKNSGSVFQQWRKGVELAKGDLVWIAEADDDVRPAFLAELTSFFKAAPDTIFAFSDSAAIDEVGKQLSDDYRFYYSTIGDAVLTERAVMPASRFAVENLSVRNHVLNVSAVLWNRKDLRTALVRAGSALADFRLAGDWRLYLEACLLDGQIGFTPESLNIHRRHAASVTGSTGLLDQVEEIKRIHDFLLDRFAGAKSLAESMLAYREELTERARRSGEPSETAPGRPGRQ